MISLYLIIIFIRYKVMIMIFLYICFYITNEKFKCAKKTLFRTEEKNYNKIMCKGRAVRLNYRCVIKLLNKNPNHNAGTLRYKWSHYYYYYYYYFIIHYIYVGSGRPETNPWAGKCGSDHREQSVSLRKLLLQHSRATPVLRAPTSVLTDVLGVSRFLSSAMLLIINS